MKRLFRKRLLMKRLLNMALFGLMALTVVSSSYAIDRKRDKASKPATPIKKQYISSEAREKAALAYYLQGMAFEDSRDMFGAFANYDTALFYDSESYTVRMAYIRAAALIGKYQPARDAAGKLELDDIDALKTLVDLYREAEMEDSVVYFLGLLAEVDPSNMLARQALASYYEQSGDLASAIPYRVQIAEDRNTYQGFNELGALHFLVGSYPEAAEAFRRAIRLEPGAVNIPSYSGLADALGEMDSLGLQRIALDEMLALDSTYVPSHRRFIDYYSRQRQYDSALIHSQAEVALTPHDKAAIRRLGIIAYSADSLDLAEEQFNELISIGETDFTNYFFLGRIFLEKEKYTYALINFGSATRAIDSIADGWIGIGQVYVTMDSLPQAEASYQTGIEKVTALDDKIRLLFSLGAVQERQQKMDLAEKSFDNVLALDSLNAPALNYLGYMLVDINERLPYAKDLIRRALEVNPNNGAYIDSYGWALFREGSYPEALDSLQRALELFDADPTVYEHIGDTYDKLNMPDSADVYWRRALELDGPDEKSKATLREKLNR